jgi:hypothetical protein
MPERNVMTRGVCIACVVSLLVAVISSPIRPLHSVDKAFHTTSLMRNFSTSPKDSIRLYFKAATDDTSAINADVIDDDEEDKFGLTTGLGLSFFFPPPTPSPKRSTKPITHCHLSQASWVLRC